MRDRQKNPLFAGYVVDIIPGMAIEGIRRGTIVSINGAYIMVDVKLPSGEMVTAERYGNELDFVKHKGGNRIDWVSCPICGESDMRRETDEEGYSLIFCVNHGCESNGGEVVRTSSPLKTWMTNIIRLARGRCRDCGQKINEDHGPFWGGGWPHRCKK